MVEKHSTDQGRLSRRSWLLGAGTLAILSGTVGCLGLGEDDEEAGEPENETDSNSSEDTSTEPDSEENETTDTESNDTVSDDAEGSEPEDDDSSILEQEPNDNESDDGDENDSEGDQADLDNESDDNEIDAEEENDTGNETQESNTVEESQENLDNNGNESSDGDENDSERNQDESEEKEREFEQIIIEELSYQVDYPADWEMVETDESIPVVIANSDETAWIWIDIRETSLDLEGDITNYRQNFEPHPDFEIHEDEPMILSSGEDGHRFVIEVTENPENPLIAHELLANEYGNEYLTSVQISRPEYDEEYAELAEEILASVTLL